MTKTKILVATLLLFGGSFSAIAEEVPYKIGEFPQEYAQRLTQGSDVPEGNVVSIHIGPDGAVYAKTEAALFVRNEDGWSKLSAKADAHIDPAYGRDAAGELREVPFPRPLVHDIVSFGDLSYVVINDGVYRANHSTGKVELVLQQTATQLAVSPNGRVAAASPNGLFLSNEDGEFTPLTVDDERGLRWGAAKVLAVAFDGYTLHFATPAGWATVAPDKASFQTPDQGLPYNGFTCMAVGKDGEIWFGTDMGIVRYTDGEWHYRQGARWLPNDQVNDIAIDANGDAYIATADGVGVIRRMPMTLAKKAELYENTIEEKIKRTPYGYTSEVRLEVPGRPDLGIIKTDSDNDGLWTAMYGAGECYAYAATGDPKAKERATKAFEALLFLNEVTQGGSNPAPKGFAARTILPTDGPDPNDGRLERDIREQEEDAIWKAYEPRWPTDESGDWYWKSDTSSDELDGHYFFYPRYYDLVAETEEEKARVVEVVRNMTDHLIEHDFSYVDHTGTPTRWGYYGPKEMNYDPDWWEERGLKSLSMLSYLAVAEHMTGDKKYGKHLTELAEEHGYRANAMLSKQHFGPGSGNQSDDEMAFMCFYNFMEYVEDPTLRNMIGYSFYQHYILDEPEMNPFFNFCYAAHGMDAVYVDPWGTHPITPWDGWLEDSMDVLTGFPLDRLNWASKNSHRLDIVMLRRQDAGPPMDPAQTGRGYRTNGKVLPIENRHFNHWNNDPWRLDYGGDGSTLGSGAVYLLPYYMGLYHGFIEETE